ncbi:MAG: hypothetical protein WBA57_12810 [Elainellaceae cyanobacterium]
MNYFVPALIVFLIQFYLLLSWFRSFRKKDGKEKILCFFGFLLGQIYLLWEIVVVKQTGKPLPGSIEQKELMGRFLLGGTIGGVFTILGLFYLSFWHFRTLPKIRVKDKSK